MSFSIPLSLFILLRWFQMNSSFFCFFRPRLLSYRVTKLWTLSPLSEAKKQQTTCFRLIRSKPQLATLCLRLMLPFHLLFTAQAVTCKYTHTHPSLGTDNTSTSIKTCRQMVEPHSPQSHCSSHLL